MANLFTVTANKVNDHVNGKTAFTMPSQVWAALVTTNNAAGAPGTEATYTGYARIQIPAASFNASASGSATNSAIIQFAARTDAGAAQTIVGVALFDASSAGNGLRWVNGLSLSVTQGVAPYIDVNTLTTSAS